MLLINIFNLDVPASCERRQAVQNANRWMELYEVNKHKGDYIQARDRLSALWQWFHLVVDYTKRYINALLTFESKEISTTIGKLFTVYK